MADRQSGKRFPLAWKDRSSLFRPQEGGGRVVSFCVEYLDTMPPINPFGMTIWRLGAFGKVKQG
jgi:hypothetical protein